MSSTPKARKSLESLEVGPLDGHSSTACSDQDPEMEGLTPFEKKTLVVRRELSKQGMGRYQWMIFILCGCGYFLDLLWANTFATLLASVQQEFGFSDADAGNFGTAFSAGLTVGAAVWGVLVDIIGRYWAFNFTILLAGVFGSCLGAPASLAGILVLTAAVGLGVGGNIPIDTTICLEVFPKNKLWLLPILSVFQPLGSIVAAVLAYAYIPSHSCDPDLVSCNNGVDVVECCRREDNMGWRYMLFTNGGITLFLFGVRFLLFRFKETPYFLLSRGRDAEAVHVLQYIARYNGVPCSINSADQLRDAAESGSANHPKIGVLVAATDAGATPRGSNFSLHHKRQRTLKSTASAHASIELAATGGAFAGGTARPGNLLDKIRAEISRINVLFSSARMAWLTVSMWLIYVWDFWSFSLAGGFLPLVLREKGTALDISLTENYEILIYYSLFGIPGVLLGSLIYKWQRPALLVTSVLYGAMCFTFTTINSKESYIGISGLVYFSQSAFNAVLYGATPQFFPTPVRGTACGMASFWGRVMSIVAPLIGARVLAVNVDGVFYLAGAGVFLASLFILLLPPVPRSAI